VHDSVDRQIARRLERLLVVGQEVVTTPAPLDPRPRRQIEPQVGIGEEQDADGGRGQTGTPGGGSSRNTLA